LRRAAYPCCVREEARYVLYLWRDGQADGAWRGSLTDVRTHRVRRFRDIAGLQAFLDERTARSRPLGRAGTPDTRSADDEGGA
jgi:hypothetical protein